MAVLKSKPKAKSTSNIPNNPKMAVFSLGAFCLKAYKYVYIYRDIEIYIERERETCGLSGALALTDVLFYNVARIAECSGRPWPSCWPNHAQAASHFSRVAADHLQAATPTWAELETHPILPKLPTCHVQSLVICPGVYPSRQRDRVVKVMA